ncbi:MAG: copper-binding protein [Burkholderiaceae bacterium]|jgi:Cu/Ag efflux protein CusF|nr:copper-binding protein [Burkholderiaceae bacterium]
MKIRSLAALTGALAAPLVISLAQPALAQHNHGAHGAPAKTATAQSVMYDGEIRRIDTAKGTVLIKHGEMKELGMGPMTMGFKLKDAALGAGLKAGDRVKFAAEQKGEELIVTRIQKAQ